MATAPKKPSGYVVVADGATVLIPSNGANEVRQIFRGGPVPDGASPESIAHLLEIGFIVPAE